MITRLLRWIRSAPHAELVRAERERLRQLPGYITWQTTWRAVQWRGPADTGHRIEHSLITQGRRVRPILVCGQPYDERDTIALLHPGERSWHDTRPCPGCVGIVVRDQR